MNWLKIVLLTAGYLILASVIAEYFVAHNVMVNGDFFTFWGGGKLVSAGRNPYDPAEWLAVHQAAGSTWLENPTFVYPLPVAVLFVPLSKLSVNLAATIWLFFCQVFLLGSIILTALAVKWTRAKVFIPFLVLGAAFFRPTLVTMTNGQMSGLLLLATAAAAYFWSRRQWFWGGAVISLLVLKPTAALFFLPAAGFWMLWRREWKGLIGMGTMLALLWAVGAVMQPGWLADFIAIGQWKVTMTWGVTYPPTIWGWMAYLTNLTPNWQVYAGIIAFGGMGLGMWLALRAARADQWLMMIGVVMPLALIAAPYLWNYDQVILVVPILVIASLVDQTGRSFAVVALLPIMVDLLAVALFVLARYLNHDAWGLLLPIFVVIIFGGVSSYIQKNREKPIANFNQLKS